MALLAATVYVRDPDTFAWVTCDAGTEPEPHLAALIRTPAAWQDGLPPEPRPGADTDADPTPAPPATEQEPEGAEPEKKPRTRRPAKADE